MDYSIQIMYFACFLLFFLTAAIELSALKNREAIGDMMFSFCFLFICIAHQIPAWFDALGFITAGTSSIAFAVKAYASYKKDDYTAAIAYSIIAGVLALLFILMLSLVMLPV